MAEAAKMSWFLALLRDFEGRLLRYAQRFVGPEGARELVQETYARIWQENWVDLQGRERAWLFSVCRNLALDHLKKEKRLDYANAENSVPPEAETQLEKNEEEGEVQAAVRLLTTAQQEVVRLKFQEAMSYSEISAITGHSVSHVGVLLHEALKKLRQQLSGGAL
jgi:RNA polymerase sigma factor (sigma-70 family)